VVKVAVPPKIRNGMKNYFCTNAFCNMRPGGHTRTLMEGQVVLQDSNYDVKKEQRQADVLMGFDTFYTNNAGEHLRYYL
jgi:hypothetical protein